MASFTVGGQLEDESLQRHAQAGAYGNDSPFVEPGRSRESSSASVTSLLGDTNELSINDHFDVVSALTSMKNKWKPIGSALGILQTDLSAIKLQCGSDLSEALDQMVSKWLTQGYDVGKFGGPSWERLIRAVAHHAGGADRAKAKEIQREHPRSESGVVSSHPSTSSVSSGSVFKMEETTQPSTSQRTKQWTAPITIAMDENKMIEAHSSYHLSIPGSEAIRRLQSSGKDCCYLTRFSENQDCYILSVFMKQTPQNVDMHFQIMIEGSKKRLRGHTLSFDHIDDLLAHYEKKEIHPSLWNIGYNYTEKEYKKDLLLQQQAFLKRLPSEDKHGSLPPYDSTGPLDSLHTLLTTKQPHESCPPTFQQPPEFHRPPEFQRPPESQQPPEFQRPPRDMPPPRNIGPVAPEIPPEIVNNRPPIVERPPQPIAGRPHNENAPFPAEITRPPDAGVNRAPGPPQVHCLPNENEPPPLENLPPAAAVGQGPEENEPPPPEIEPPQAPLEIVPPEVAAGGDDPPPPPQENPPPGAEGGAERNNGPPVNVDQDYVPPEDRWQVIVPINPPPQRRRWKVCPIL